MNFSDLFLTMAQTAEIEQISMFPFPFNLHLTFCCISFLFFMCRFIREKAVYQLIMALAIPFSLLIWLANNNKALFYTIGIIELLLLISSFVTYKMYEKKKTAVEKVSESSVDVKQENQSEEEES